MNGVRAARILRGSSGCRVQNPPAIIVSSSGLSVRSPRAVLGLKNTTHTASVNANIIASGLVLGSESVLSLDAASCSSAGARKAGGGGIDGRSARASRGLTCTALNASDLLFRAALVEHLRVSGPLWISTRDICAIIKLL